MAISNKAQETNANNRTKLNLVLGTIITICVLALIAWNNGVFQTDKNPVVANIGDESFTAAQVEFYYNQQLNSTYNLAQMYAQMGMQSKYDPTLDPDEQFYNEQKNYTYADYFRDTALEQLQNTTVLMSEASLNDFTLSEEAIASVDAQLQQIDEQLLQYSVTYGGSESYYFSLLYGEHMTKALMRELISDATLASEYANVQLETFDITDEERDAYYADNTSTLDSYNYRFFYIPVTPETDVDEEGEALAATEEQIATAKEEALDSANKAKRSIRRGQAFNKVAADYVAEEYKASFEDENFNLISSQIGQRISAPYAHWLLDDARKKNEVDVVENGDSGYYIVQFLGRDRLEDSYQTLNLNSVLVLAERNEDELPSEEQLSTAKTAAEDLSQNWTNALTTGTGDTFLTELTDYQNEALADVTREDYNSDFTSWAFEARKTLPTETFIVEELEDNNVVGYRVMQITDFGDAEWSYYATTALQNEAYDAWYTEKQDEFLIEKNEFIDLVGAKTDAN